MVGIAGRSKACHSCRKRRVACGYERPHCVRCQKAGLECPGYQRRATFVNRTLASPFTTAQSVVSTPTGEDDAGQDVVDDYHAMSRAFASSSYTTSGFRSTAFRILRRLYLPRDDVADESLAVGTSFWVASVCGCMQESLTLDHSLLALCAAQLYITNQGDLSLDQALKVYSGGLARLAASLEHVDYSTLATLLGSIVTLSTCELFVCPLNSGWQAHVQGMAQLLRYRFDLSQSHRGAAAQQAWIRLGARVRIASILTGLMSQTRSSVTATQWRAIMPDRAPDDPLDDLLDIISDLPTMFAEPQTLEAPITSMLRTLGLVYDWERRFRERTAAPLCSFVPSRLSNPADDGHDEKLYPLVLDFPALQVASCLIICWAAILQTLTVVMRLYDKEAGNGSRSLLLEPVWQFLDRKKFRHIPPETAIIVEAKRKAGQLCQCVEYTHRAELGSLGPQSMTYARTLLRRYYAQQRLPRELAWCQNIPYMTNERGEKFAVQLPDFEA